MSDGPLVSVITPVYNGETFLAECIESILNQTFGNWEFIIADNMSTDGTNVIAERFAAQDARIRVVRGPDFVDMYTNHNRALQLMDPRSRYCKVVHADDWLYPHCLERMVAIAEANPAVGLVTSFRLVGTHVEHEVPLPYSQCVMPGRDLIRWELLGEGRGRVTGSPTSVLMRGDCVRKTARFYDPTIWHADTVAAYEVLAQSDFGFVHEVLSYTRWHPGAATPYSYRVWSFITLDGLLCMRYGRRTLSQWEYRASLRTWLRRYGTWLAKQFLKPARHHDREFKDFHRREIGYLIDEAGDDRATARVLAMYLALLVRP